MSGLPAARALALGAPLSFALLAGSLAVLGAVPVVESTWAAVSVLVAFVPSALWSPGGWRRRAAELSVLPVAYALTLVGDPTMRRMMIPPLLILAALAALMAAAPRVPRRHLPYLGMALALAVRAAGGAGLAGEPPWRVVVALLVTAALGWGATYWAGLDFGTLVSLVAGCLPLQHHLVSGSVVGLAIIGAGLTFGAPGWVARVARGWMPAGVVIALLGSAVGPWGGMPVAQALPEAGTWSLVLLGAAAVATPWVPPAAAGVIWLAVTLGLGPAVMPPADRAQQQVNAGSPVVTLPATTGGPYVLDVTMANAAAITDGTQVATLVAEGTEVPIRAGHEVAEWAHQREDVAARVAHSLPDTPIWRPAGLGREAVWAVSGRTGGVVPAGLVPEFRRNPKLPVEVTVVVAMAGPSVPTPPRDWPLRAWLVACAVVVAVLQVLGRSWARPWAFLPWALLAAGSVVTRMPVEPLHLIGGRHGVDLALASLLAAWFPLARSWLARGRAFATALALLLPLTLAAPHLCHPVGDEPYHLLLLKSLRSDLDLDLSDDYDVENHPENQVYITPRGWYLHSPVLALLLFPGYALAGRAGVGVLLALAGAAVVWAVSRRARSLGLPRRGAALLSSALLLSYPLVTFSGQLWPEIVGAALASVAVVLLSSGRAGPVLIAGLAVLGSWIKVRLGLLLFPLAVVAWWPKEWKPATRRRLVVAGILTAAAALALGYLWFGNLIDTIPGRRRFSHLIPRSLDRPATVVAGLAFDAAGGLAFAAPLLLVALLGAVLLWRQGGKGEKALLVGGVFTVAALLNNFEWRGGDSPPARYLVPLLPLFGLAGAMLLRRAAGWRRLLWILVPPTLLAWWVFATRPYLGVNTGTGGFWLSDALAARLALDVRHLFPSFLRFSAASVAVPAVVVVLFAGSVWLSRWRPGFGRLLARQAVAIWLAAATGLLVYAHLRFDRRVELEDPQVRRIGGELYPEEGQMARYLFMNGWAVKSGEGVEVSLKLPSQAWLTLHGWLEGDVDLGGTVVIRWDEEPETGIPVAGGERGHMRLPPPPGPGKHDLRVLFFTTGNVEAVLDSVVVRR